eukprot:scaffold23627_cov121-Isochrysis_galbana.AAC.5
MFTLHCQQHLLIRRADVRLEPTVKRTETGVFELERLLVLDELAMLTAEFFRCCAILQCAQLLMQRCCDACHKVVRTESLGELVLVQLSKRARRIKLVEAIAAPSCLQR